MFYRQGVNQSSMLVTPIVISTYISNAMYFNHGSIQNTKSGLIFPAQKYSPRFIIPLTLKAKLDR